MTTKISTDPRIDPRIKAMFGAVELPPSPDVPDRETLLARANSAEAAAQRAMIEVFFDKMDSEDVASSKGLTSRWEVLVSKPDGNTIRIHFIRPDNSDAVPCVYYIHGGGMAFLSAERASTRRGGGPLRRKASLWPWSISGTASFPRRSPRWLRFPQASMTACPA